MEDLCVLPELFVPGKLGIATVLYNSSQVLSDFAASLRSQTYSNFVVFAVDNASSDGSAAICRKEGSRYRITENQENTGFAHGSNQGIRQAIEDGCEYIMLLNNDVVFEATLFENLLHGMQRHKADLVAPLTYFHDRPDVIWAAGGKLQKILGYRPQHLGEGVQDTGDIFFDRPIQFAPGSCILLHRSVFAHVGLLDEAFYTYWEDTDFAVRALKAELRFFLIADAKLWHKVSSLSGKDSPFQRYYSVRNHALYLLKHTPQPLAKLLSLAYLSWYFWGSLRHGKRDQRVAHWKEGLRLASIQR